MAGHRIRPTFSVPLRKEPDQAMEILRERLRGADFARCARSKGRCVDLFVEGDERRVWSPYLSVQLEPSNDGSLLRGRFGPHPELWTLFVFLYASVGFFTVLGLILGFVQWQSHMAPWGLWGAWIGGPGLAILYTVSAIGQRLSAHQMDGLLHRVDRLVEGLRADGQSPST